MARNCTSCLPFFLRDFKIPAESDPILPWARKRRDGDPSQRYSLRLLAWKDHQGPPGTSYSMDIYGRKSLDGE